MYKESFLTPFNWHQSPMYIMWCPSPIVAINKACCTCICMYMYIQIHGSAAKNLLMVASGTDTNYCNLIGQQS